jgi:hypothetical protein
MSKIWNNFLYFILLCSCFCFCLFVVVFCCCCIILILMTHVLVNNEIAYIILKKRLEGPQLRLFTYMYLKCCCAHILYIYMIDLDRRHYLKSRSYFRIFSNRRPFQTLIYIGPLTRYKFAIKNNCNDSFVFLICYFACFCCCCVFFKHFPIL